MTESEVEAELKRLSEKYGFSYTVLVGVAIIKTAFSSWKFDYTSPPYHLFHRPAVIFDYKCCVKNSDGYHNQNRKFTDLEELCDYITTHDRDLFKKPKFYKKTSKRS